jgi:hypothetical protein
MWKEALIVHYMVLFQNFPEALKKTTENDKIIGCQAEKETWGHET